LKKRVHDQLENTFSNYSIVSRDRFRNSSIKERAQKISNSLSPVSRMPFMNNLAELLKRKDEALLETPTQMLVNETDLLSNSVISNTTQNRRLAFLSKACKIKKDL
jgi:hypothetical protein